MELSDKTAQEPAEGAQAPEALARACKCIQGPILAQLALPYPSLSGNHANRQGNGRIYKREEAREFELEVRRRIVNSRYAGMTINQRIEVEFNVWPPDARARDQANVCKVVEDACTRAGLWSDDSNRIIRKTTFLWHDFEREEPGGCVMLTVRAFG